MISYGYWQAMKRMGSSQSISLNLPFDNACKLFYLLGRNKFIKHHVGIFVFKHVRANLGRIDEKKNAYTVEKCV
jgi:hypothetical protein